MSADLKFSAADWPKANNGRFVDRIGWRTGRLTLLECVGKGPTRYRCKCDCGNEVIAVYSHLQAEDTRSCGCIRREACRARERRKNHPTHGIVVTYYKHNAKTRGLPWELGSDDVTRLIAANCHYCGAVPATRHIIGKELRYNGIDRVDNKVGYKLSNCVPCCFQCNNAKGAMSYKEFKAWIGSVYGVLYGDDVHERHPLSS